jgi:hypothetical protein
MFNTEAKHNEKRDRQIIFDFIKSRDDLNGCGYFQGDREAIQYAMMVGKNQEMKFRKHGIVPKALIKMMAQHWVFQGKGDPIYRDVAYGEFLTILMKGPYKNEAGRQVGEKFYRDLLVKDMPWLKRSFAMADGFYDWHEKQRPSKKDAEKMGKEVTPIGE